MIKIGAAALAALLLVWALCAYVLPGFLFTGFSKWGESDTLEANLTYITLGEFLADAGQVEAVAIYDEGLRNVAPAWHIIADPTTAAEASFGFPKTRLLDAFAGQHVTGYCSSNGVLQGKIVWALSGGAVAKARVYCARRRMDIAALVAMGVPAKEIQRDDLTASAYHALEAKIAASPNLFGALRSEVEPFSHQCRVTFPYIWSARDDARGFMPKLVREATLALLQETLGGSGYDVDYRDGYASTYVMHAAEGMDNRSAEGWAVDTPYVWVQQSGETRKAPGISLYRPDVRLKGSAADCAAFEALDFSTVVSGYRDAALLEQVWHKGVAQTKIGGGPAVEMAVLRADPFAWVTSREITYRLEYFDIQP